MACSLGCTKTGDIVYSSIFLALGLGVLAVGIWSIVDTDVYYYMTLDDLNVNGDISVISTYVVTAVGGYMIVTSIVGIPAAATLNKGAIIGYLVMGSLLALFELGTGILLIVMYTWQGGPLTKGMLNFVVSQYNGYSSLSYMWDTMQQKLQCCGSWGPGDWKIYNSTWYLYQGKPSGWDWPQSCCFMVNPYRPIDLSACQNGHYDSMYRQGCYSKLSNWVETWSLVLLILMMVFFAFQVGAVGAFGALIERMKHPTNKVSPADSPDEAPSGSGESDSQEKPTDSNVQYI